MDELKIERLFITPQMAKDFLKLNGINRPIQPNVVNNYVSQMKRGQWQEDTGEMIKFSPSGRLLDGQHRLTALVNYDKGLFFHIIRNVHEATFSVLDTGRRRNSSDVLSISGVPNATATAGGITSFIVLRQGKVNQNKKSTMGITNEDIINEYNSRPEFWNYIVTKSHLLYKSFNRTLSPSTVIGWYAILSDIDTEKADIFMEKLCTGIGFLTNTDPIAQLRAILAKSKNTFHHKLTLAYKTAIIIKAWNYFFTGKEVRLFRFDEKNEIYPILNTGGKDFTKSTSDAVTEDSIL